MVKKRKNRKKNFLISFLKRHWLKASFWLVGMIVGLLLTKACNAIWPDVPVAIKEYTDTVKLIHSIDHLQFDKDSIIRKQIENQLKNIELLNKYEEQITRKRDKTKADVCKIIIGNPYPHSHGYLLQSSSSYCYIKLTDNSPFIDITYDFIRDDYIDLINTLCVKIYRNGNDKRKESLVLDINYEPHKEQNGLLIRMVNDLQQGEYTIEAGFILKENRSDEYPAFYRHTFTFKKKVFI